MSQQFQSDSEASIYNPIIFSMPQTDGNLTISTISYTRCLQVLSKPIFNPFLAIIALISVAGVVLNYINFHYIFHFKSRFHQFLKIYSLGSSIICLSLFVNGTVRIFFPQFPLYVAGYWASSMRLFFNHILITFGSILDTYIVFERLKIFNPKFKLFYKTSILKICFGIFLFSASVNIIQHLHANEVKTAKNLRFLKSKCNLNIPADLPKIKFLNPFESNPVTKTLTFTVFNYFFVILKNFVTIIIDLIANIYLIVSIKKFYKRKYTLTQGQSFRKDSYKSYDKKKAKIALILTTLSCVSRVLDLMFRIMKLNFPMIDKNVYTLPTVLDHLMRLQLSARNTANFFIFFKIDKRFNRLLREKLFIFRCFSKVKGLIFKNNNNNNNN
jgi:hypothetical protein